MQGNWKNWNNDALSKLPENWPDPPKLSYEKKGNEINKEPDTTDRFDEGTAGYDEVIFQYAAEYVYIYLAFVFIY